MSEIIKFLGIGSRCANHKEIVIATMGAFFGIGAIFLISTLMLDPEVSVYIIPSMGASAVLLFAVPHAPFSQPWNVFMGHLVSAFVGVTVAMMIPNIPLAGSIGVGLAVMTMHYTRCIHPPGGATALAAVIGSAKLKGLGFAYVIAPVLLNTLVILFIAVLFNAFFSGRQYPLYLNNKRGGVKPDNP